MIKNKLLVSVLVSLGVSLLLVLLLSINSFHGINLGLSDRLYAAQKPLNEITVIAIDDKSLGEIGRWPWPRDVFANILDRLNESMVIGIDLSFFEKSSDDALLEQKIEGMKDKIVLVSECEFKDNCSWTYPIFNATEGYANIFVDKNIVRSIPLALEGKKSFSAVIAEKYGIKPENEKIIPRFSRYNALSFSDALRRNQSEFKDKIVLIGVTAKDLHDEKSTPIGIVSGIEIHASAIQTIILGNRLDYQGRASEVIAIILLSLITILILYQFKPLIASIMSFMLLAAYFLTAIFAYDSGIIMNLFFPLLSIMLTYLAAILLYYALESRQRKFIANLFGKYVSPSVADELIRQGKSAINLKGTKKAVTVLFADVRGFTAFSEKNPPEAVVAILNKYLSKMTDVVFKHNGTLDKYVGDEIMATYNVPLDMPEHALSAVKTALEMQEESKKLGNLKYGIGINTGPAIVGNIGSEKRLDYTVIGDSVNLGARLCSKAEADQILISDSTFQMVKDKINAKYLGEIQVKGKEQAIKVYEVIGLK